VTETVAAALRRGAALLAAAGIERPAREARLLLAHALRAASAELLDGTRPVVTEPYDDLLARRAAREPFAHLTGTQGFWTLDLAVSPAALIPRADTETLIEALLAAFPNPESPRRILDLGTGTGALLLAALAEYPQALGIGIDRSPAALALAVCNARETGLAGRAMFVTADWGACLRGEFDAVLANPPYIRSGDIELLMPEVAVYEPRSALDGGPDGLAAYRRILPDLPSLLSPGGVAVLEIGADQADPVMALAQVSGLQEPVLRQDLGGNARALVLRRTGS